MSRFLILLLICLIIAYASSEESESLDASIVQTTSGLGATDQPEEPHNTAHDDDNGEHDDYGEHEENVEQLFSDSKLEQKLLERKRKRKERERLEVMDDVIDDAIDDASLGVMGYFQILLNMAAPFTVLFPDDVSDDMAQLITVVIVLGLFFFALSYWKSVIKELLLISLLVLDVYIWIKKMQVLGGSLLVYTSEDLDFTDVPNLIETFQNVAQNSDEAFIIFSEMAFFTGCCWLFLGLVYQYLPVGLIPNFIPFLGSLDEWFFALIGFVGLVLFTGSTYMQVQRDMESTSGHTVYISIIGGYENIITFMELDNMKKIEVMKSGVDYCFQKMGFES